MQTSRRIATHHRAWLERTLASAATVWKIVALHHPPYSAGYQGSSEEAREVFRRSSNGTACSWSCRATSTTTSGRR